jgi:TldD protein
MGFNKILTKSKTNCKSLLNILLKKYEYVSILGVASKGSRFRVDSKNTFISDSDIEYGYVCKIFNGKGYSEYSFSKIIGEDVNELANKIIGSITLENVDNRVSVNKLNEEEMVKVFNREDDGILTDSEIVENLTKLKDQMEKYDSRIINAISMYNKIEISKFFISSKKDLEQFYTWSNCYIIPVARNEQQIKNKMFVGGSYSSKEAFKECFDNLEETCHIAIELLDAKPIVPGVYDVITDPSITGLIAHEAFGHGVEMDMFVKNRAKSVNYIDKYVASPLISMHDGACATDSVASYFFDDDGVLAHDTQIIKDGILVSGICDLTSSRELDFSPTGNGRRETYKRKAYTRMTNTFIEKGNDKLSDMIKSIKHGYFLFETNNGMEDPKNWAIQCTAEYGIEIVDGKLTDNYVAPVVMSGNVLDLLKSISMISDEFELEGAGSCGKGYKEWVRVSSGGPNLKCRVKLS